MKKRILLWCFNFILIVIIMSTFNSIIFSVTVPYQNYNYNYWEQPTPAPPAYIPDKVINGKHLGIDYLDKPRDIYVSMDNNIYIADSGNDRILVCDENWEIREQITKFTDGTTELEFDSPQGVYVDHEKNIYIADTGNNRVVVLDANIELVRIIEKPQEHLRGILDEDFRFRPLKLAVSPDGRLYVVAEGVYDGLMQFDIDGYFSGFIGVPRLAPEMVDIIWNMIATEAQRQRRELFLPTEYSNLDIDQKEGFIYATVSEGQIIEDEPIRKLNPAGDDILRRRGYLPPVGDSRVDESGYEIDSSNFRDITALSGGNYSVIDSERGRVFTYDYDGNLLYLFGGNGNLKGGFRNPVALDSMDEKFLVLDARRGDITVFKRTEYAKLIHNAINEYEEGFYEEANESWQRVLDYNVNYDLAYIGLGRSHLRRENNEEAMEKFMLGNNRTYYSRAFAEYRRNVIANSFNYIILLLVITIIVIILITKFNFFAKFNDFILSNEVNVSARQYSKNISFKNKFIELCRKISYAFHVIITPLMVFGN